MWFTWCACRATVWFMHNGCNSKALLEFFSALNLVLDFINEIDGLRVLSGSRGWLLEPLKGFLEFCEVF